jgi:uncharacterized protein YjaG (DUF416 family)
MASSVTLTQNASVKSTCKNSDKVFAGHHVDLYDVDEIPSYAHQQFFAAVKQSADDDIFTIAHSRVAGNGMEGIVLLAAVVLSSVSALLIARSRQRMRAERASKEDTEVMTSLTVQYQSINK